MSEYTVEVGYTVTRQVSLPKTWFRVVNGVGTTVDLILVVTGITED